MAQDCKDKVGESALHSADPHCSLEAEKRLPFEFGEARDPHTPLCFPAALGKPPTFYWPQGVTRCFLYWTSLVFACQASNPLLMIIFFPPLNPCMWGKHVYQTANWIRDKNVFCWVSESQPGIFVETIGEKELFSLGLLHWENFLGPSHGYKNWHRRKSELREREKEMEKVLVTPFEPLDAVVSETNMPLKFSVMWDNWYCYFD